MRRLIVLSLAALCAAGCGKSPTERMAEAAIKAGTGQEVSVEQDGDTMTLKTEQGEVKISGGDAAALPGDFPKDVYLPDGYAVKSAMEMPGAVMLELEAPGEVAAIAAASGARMQADGWKRTLTMQQTSDSHVAVYEKAGRHATLSLQDQDDGVLVGVQLTSKQ